MNIRGLFPRDIEQVKAIHERFYEKEFDFDEFSGKYLSKFVVLEDEKVVIAGGIRNIPEVVLVTNKDFSVRTIREALLMSLESSKEIAQRSGHNSLHAFIQDGSWLRQLLKHGFTLTAGEAVTIKV